MLYLIQKDVYGAKYYAKIANKDSDRPQIHRWEGLKDNATVFPNYTEAHNTHDKLHPYQKSITEVEPYN